MNEATVLPNTLLETILTHLAKFFLSATAGDSAAARQAALQMLAAYTPRNPRELRLAAQIVSFSLQALASLGQAADPDVPLTRILRLRGSAVSLNREAEKAQRRLDHCQQTSQADLAHCEITHPEATHAPPAAAESDTQPTQRPLQATAAASTLSATSIWTRAEYDETNQRIAASVKRAEDRVAAINADKASTAAATRRDAEGQSHPG